MPIKLNYTQNQPKTIKLSAADHEFISMVTNRITMYGQIQYTIPELLIIDLIRSSARFFYKYYGSSWYKGFYFIKKTDIQKTKNTLTTGDSPSLTIKLSQKIRIVEGVYETNLPKGTSLTTLETTSFGGGSTTDGPVGINNNLYLLEKAVQGIETKAVTNMLKSQIPFSYNPNTNDLYLLRQIRDGSDIVLKCWFDIPLELLYNDTLFERHIIGSCKRELKRLLGGHTFELPGGIILNSEEICSGWEDVEKVEELVKAASGTGDIILKRLG